MKKILLITILCLGVSTSWAQSFTTGYSSLVVFTDDHSTRPSGETEAACQENEANIIANYESMFPRAPDPRAVSVDPSKSLPCGPRTSTVPELDLAAWLKSPFPPTCLSCPLLHPGSFGIYYPGFEAEIKDLYYQFGIDQYNYELNKLQQKFDLQQFEKQIFMLNNEINKTKQ